MKGPSFAAWIEKRKCAGSLQELLLLVNRWLRDGFPKSFGYIGLVVYQFVTQNFDLIGTEVGWADGAVACRERLGGMLRY